MMKPMKPVLAVALAGALAVSTSACELALDDMADVESTSLDLAYNPYTKRFEEQITRQVQRGNDKGYGLRVEPNSTVSVTITKNNGYNTQFKLFFSPTPVTNPETMWDIIVNPACQGSTGSSYPNTCSVTATDTYGYIIVRAVNDNNASDFTLTYDFQGPCYGQSCYLSSSIKVTGINDTQYKKPLVDPANNTLPGLLAGHHATVTIKRANNKIYIVNGVKFKAVGSNTEVGSISCTSFDSNNVKTCTIDASQDGEIHIPFKLVKNAKPAQRWATTTIVRSGEFLTGEVGDLVTHN